MLLTQIVNSGSVKEQEICINSYIYISSYTVFEKKVFWTEIERTLSIEVLMNFVRCEHQEDFVFVNLITINVAFRRKF